MLSEIVSTVLIALWVMLPAYLPNSFAALFGGGKPIDFGRTLSDGRRILGDGKTFGGFFAGIFWGLMTGLVQIWLLSKGFSIAGIAFPGFSSSGPAVLDFSAIVVLLSLSAGSLLGDMGMSFFKRRAGLKRGAALPGADQYDFILGAFILTALTSWGWLSETFTLPMLIAVIILTPALHLGTNIVGYKLGIKNEPW